MSVGDKADEGRALGKAPLPASAAHEISNPLDSLLNLLYLLETEATLTEKGRHYLTLARDEVHRISRIAKETMDQHTVRVIPERTNVGKLLAAALDFYEQKLDSLGVTVQARYCSDSTLPVYPEQLRQVFSNLLLNAVEAMPEGGKVQARVSAGHEWSGQGRRGIRVTIADNGPGIPANVLSHIFQRPFTTKSDGHGMGLSVVKDIAHKHRGLLRVRSSTQPSRHGTVFTLFLPAA